MCLLDEGANRRTAHNHNAQDVQGPVALPTEAGVLPALLLCLRAPNEALQLEAAWIVTNIATGPADELQAAGILGESLFAIVAVHAACCSRD